MKKLIFITIGELSTRNNYFLLLYYTQQVGIRYTPFTHLEERHINGTVVIFGKALLNY